MTVHILNDIATPGPCFQAVDVKIFTWRISMRQGMQLERVVHSQNAIQ